MSYQSSFPPSDKYIAYPEPPGPAPSLWSRLSRLWVQLTGPPAHLFGSAVADQERLRRSRLLCAMFLLIPFTVLSTIPVALSKPTTWITIGLLLVFGCISIILNRQAVVTASGLLFISSIELIIALLIVMQPHGIHNGNIPDFDLFVIPILIAGTILPRLFLPVLAILNILLIVAIFTLVPHDPLLTQEILVNQKGQAYTELIDGFLLQVSSAMIAYLSSWSVNRALNRANRAEELAEARTRLNEQHQREMEQKQRLEYGINVLKEVQARVANGDYNARARLQDNELAPLAFSFNLMTERLNKVLRIEHDYRLIEQALRQLLEIQSALVYGTPPPRFQATGTIADHIYPIIERSAFQAAILSQSNVSVEKIVSALQQQRTELTRLESTLSQASALPLRLSLNENTSSSQRPPSTAIFPDRSGPSQPLSSSNPIASNLSIFLEEARQRCSRISELAKQGLQETKQLSQRLKSS